jgi:protein-tyrosine phosphatase
MRTKLYRIEGPWSGRLAITPRPRGGDWLDDEVQLWRQAGLEIVVSLLTQDEVAEFGLSEEEVLCRNSGVRLISFPVPDRGTPGSREEFLDLARELMCALDEGKSIAVHCRQGVGRSALLAASLLVAAGEEAESAFRKISEARGCAVPDTDEQKEWVKSFVSELSFRKESEQRSESSALVHPA